MKNTIYKVTDKTVSIRGKIIHSDIIELPKDWKNVIDPRTITVSLTPVGAHQNLIVKRVDAEEIIIQSNGGIPIDCYYCVSAELNT
jgi:hypothetical protein